MTRDALAQRRDAEGRDIADAIGVERGMGGAERALGRGRAGLADFEMDDGVARSLLLRRSRHHVHDDERIDMSGSHILLNFLPVRAMCVGTIVGSDGKGQDQ
jgi:hypothetical protein